MRKAELLMEQAGQTAEYWMNQAVEVIDQAFGQGYAAEHPELIAGFMVAAATDQQSMYIAELTSVVTARIDQDSD